MIGVCMAIYYNEVLLAVKTIYDCIGICIYIQDCIGDKNLVLLLVILLYLKEWNICCPLIYGMN